LVEAFQHYFSLHGVSRRVILVGSYIHRDLGPFQDMGINIPSTTSILDTALLAEAENIKEPDMLHGMRRLLYELDVLDIPPGLLHTAGNNANINLRCLLMLAIRAFERGDNITEFQRSRIIILKSIAQASIQEELTNPAPDRIAFTRAMKIQDAAMQEKM
jgi:hypothetical protein